MHDFIRVSQPSIDNRFPFQEANFFLTLSMMGFHRAILEELPPIGRPGYWKGSDPHLHSRDVAALSSHCSPVFKPMIELLWKLTWSPEDRWNNISVILMLGGDPDSAGKRLPCHLHIVNG